VGIDLFLETLLGRFRDIMVLAACGPTTDLVEMSAELREIEIGLSQRFDEAGLSHLIALCEAVHRNVRSSAAPRALLDAAVVRMAALERFALASEVVKRPDARLTAAGGGVEAKPSGARAGKA
jgi:hypothetical protein